MNGDGYHVVTAEEVIMQTNSAVVASLCDALANVETGLDSQLVLDQVRKHADLILDYSEKLIQNQRVNIKAVPPTSLK